VDYESVAFGINQFYGSNALHAGQGLDHLDGIMGLGHASEVDITISVVGFEILFGSITHHSDGSSI
jgi:hypothetical protein